MENLDALLHEPLHTQITVFLAGASEAAFAELEQRFEVSDANLRSHLKQLIAAGYVAVREESGNGRPQSFYSLTRLGRAALRRYILTLPRMLAFEGVRAS